MKYNNRIKAVTISVLTSALLVGCSGGGSDSTTSTALNGIAIDPELQGATVFLDENKNSIFDSGELNTLTDNDGNYSLIIPSDKIGLPLVVTGGFDKTTKKAFTGTLSAVSEVGVNSKNITPLTTLVEKYQKQNSTKSLAIVRSELAIKLGIITNDFAKNTVEVGNEELLKLSLRIHKASQNISSSNGKNIDEVYDTLAKQLETENINTAITSTIDKEITSDLDTAKVKSLDTNLQNLPSGLNADQIALSTDSIESTIENKTNEADVNAIDIKGADSGILIDDDNKVQTEKTKQTFDSLGLSGLSDATKTKIIEDENFDLNGDNIDDIRKKLDNNEFKSLDNNDTQEIKTEQFFQENGINDSSILSDDQKDTLKTNFGNSDFDFENNDNDDFRSQLGSGKFSNGDDDLTTRLQGQINQSDYQDKINDKDAVSLADGKSIVGSIIKGPIDGALMTLKDSIGKVISSTISTQGIFVFPEQTLTSNSYTIESSGGSYEDEATGTLVEMSATQGLKTYVSKDQLASILMNKEYIAITPETTIYTGLIASGMDMNASATLIYNAMIRDSSPLAMLAGDKFLQTGDFTTAFPKDSSESFARNRAISFSYMVRDLGLDANRVFEVLGLVIDDYMDGSADGILVDSMDVNVTQEFALARTKLFQNTTNKLRDGDLSDAQKVQLQQMGFDIDTFGDQTATSDSNLTAIVDKYLTSSTLPTLNRLPVIQDEDGNTTDTKQTYTLVANTDVNVTVETPEESWITPMWRYNNNPLPVVIRTDRGTEMTLILDNKLASDSTIHWHGFKIPAIMDGGPDVPVASNTIKDYTFTMDQPAASLWFHPHPDMETGKQVYMGLAGVYLLEDDITKGLETANELPSGDKDTILLVQDRRFTTEVNGIKNLAYKNMDMDMDGMLGDTVLVNGSVVPKQEVSNTLHRYRLYNVSNARTYDFALSDGSDFKVIGTDGGLLNEPVSVNHIRLGAAERIEIVIDFSKYSIGDKVMLVSKPFNGGSMGMMNMDMSGMDSTDSMSSMDGMDSTDSMVSMGMNISDMSGMNGNSDNNMTGMLNNGEGLAIMRFDIISNETETTTLYTELPVQAEVRTRTDASSATNAGNERTFVMSMSMGGDMSFVINGKEFDMDRVDEFVPENAVEIWKITNMSPMAHPFHAHAIQYQILTRNGIEASGVDLGWKDTFLVQPGETVRVIGDFSSAIGDYMYHCHILEHEDAGMMGYFRVGDTGNLDN